MSKKREKRVRTEGVYHAYCKGIAISPSKVNKLAEKLRGKTYLEALMFLAPNFKHKLVDILVKTLKSAAFNATYLEGAARTELVVTKAFANQGTILKRVQPRAKGKAYAIQKKMSHLTIELVRKQENEE